MSQFRLRSGDSLTSAELRTELARAVYAVGVELQMVFDYHFRITPRSISSIVRIHRDRSVLVTNWAMENGITRGWADDSWEIVLPTADPATITTVLECGAQMILQAFDILSNKDTTVGERVTAMVWSEMDLVAATLKIQAHR